MPSSAQTRHQLQRLLVRTGMVRTYEALRGLLRGQGVCILMGHRVLDDDDPQAGLQRSQLAELIECLQRRYRIVPLEEACRQLAAQVREPLIVLTFDDGYADNYRNMWPVIRACEVPATIFITTSFIGTRRRIWTLEVHDWLRRTPVPLAEPAEAVVGRLKRLPVAERETALAGLCRRLGVTPTEATDAERMMTAEELREIATDPLITIGAHTAHHEILSTVPPQQAQVEIAESAADLERLLGERPRVFAYPNGGRGDYTPEHVAMLQELGFEAAVTTMVGLNRPGGDPLQLWRMPFGTGECVQLAWRMSTLRHCHRGPVAPLAAD